MKYYLASGLENHARVQEVAALLNGMGHVRTYDWTSHGDIRREGPTRMQEVSAREVSSVTGADFVLFLFPGGKGTHTELGAALATGRRVLLWSETGKEFSAGNGQTDPAVCAFYFHPMAERIVCPYEELGNQLKQLV
ncbi:MAG: hypothetical protein PHO41_07795 [Eubacteriales bacterium]|nr:hypothetical protein [Eubacteriales bacterium]